MLEGWHLRLCWHSVVQGHQEDGTLPLLTWVAGKHTLEEGRLSFLHNEGLCFLNDLGGLWGTTGLGWGFLGLCWGWPADLNGGLAACLTGLVDGHTLVGGGVLRQGLDDHEGVRVTLQKHLEVAVLGQLAAVLEPVHVQGRGAHELGIQPHQVAWLALSVLDGLVKAGRHGSRSALLALGNHQVGGALGAATAVLCHDGKHARVLQEHLTDGQDTLVSEGVNQEVRRAGDEEVLAVPLYGGHGVTIKLHHEASGFPLIRPAWLDLLGEEGRLGRLLRWALNQTLSGLAFVLNLGLVCGCDLASDFQVSLLLLLSLALSGGVDLGRQEDIVSHINNS